MMRETDIHGTNERAGDSMGRGGIAPHRQCGKPVLDGHLLPFDLFPTVVVVGPSPIGGGATCVVGLLCVHVRDALN